jgi:hypothetical protein
MKVSKLGILAASAVASLIGTATFAAEPVTFNARSAQSGLWSDAQTWEKGRTPQAGDLVQVRTGHTVTYDVDSNAAIRMVRDMVALTGSS